MLDLSGSDCCVIAERNGVLVMTLPRWRVVDVGVGDLCSILDGMGGTTRYRVTARNVSAPLVGGARHKGVGVIYLRFAGLDYDLPYMVPRTKVGRVLMSLRRFFID